MYSVGFKFSVGEIVKDKITGQICTIIGMSFFHGKEYENKTPYDKSTIYFINVGVFPHNTRFESQLEESGVTIGC